MKEFKTPFMWAGSKDKNWKDIKKFIPKEYDSYVEPFLGGGSIYFRLLNGSDPKKCKLAEINRSLRLTYEIIRDEVEYITENLPTKKDKKIFNEWMKDRSNLSKKDTALRFLYLNRNRFFGMGGWMKADRYARETVIERLKFFSPRMKHTEIYSDAFDIPINENDFVFCDPPYPETNNQACYKINDLEILKLNKDYLDKLVKTGCSFLFITKNITEIRNHAEKLKCKFEIKKWTYRKPKQDPVVSEEIWIFSKRNNSEFFDFS